MILELLQPDVIAFILEHENTDVNELLLKHKNIHGVPVSLIADQIKGRQKAKHKLPSFYRSRQVVYPPTINLEQSSSELTALFKLNFVRRLFGNRTLMQGADLSGGLGIDALFLSRAFNEYHFVEPNARLIKVARHNHQTLEAKNIAYENLNADTFLDLYTGNLDLAYVDPSRRAGGNRKVFSLSDCEPNVRVLQETIFKKTGHLLIKASPLLDISIGVKEIRFVKKICVVAVDNECKELLFYSEAGFSGHPAIEAINLSQGKEMPAFEFSQADEQKAEVGYSRVRKYLYEPDAAILKAGAFKLIALRFAVHKLHPNTHLYTSDEVVLDFPGRIFRLECIVRPEAKLVKHFFTEGKANVFTRNYPLSPEQLKKKTGLKDGGDKYLIGFTDISRKSVVAAERIR